MYLPAVALMIVFVIYPLIQGVHISLTNWNGYSQTYKYVGLQNYRKLFTDVMFHTAFRNTLVYGFGSALIQTGLGLLYALLPVSYTHLYLKNEGVLSTGRTLS